ncbi:FMN reductase (NADPH)/FMN reductase [NAD(P)H] [Dehalogenimonas formicexedens]|uniref:FMN reductase (NADPH)/FMN reductase [NAD(P)H] n=1 Tax=Dehalogenimonas formicexedens TaxID=1839801 RepID=A0A1P8F8P0_9CHLR|nr:nitroreductase family protein [Dehalogenimonas formicexedens]APV44803.1 FMN reductase (NADPH)/FMN reductase [NAD(P)H] [Dehalogenimonas formicexedens]
MNDTLKVILNRRSVRAYSGRPVTREEKDQILAATLRAPTAGNLMLYSIIEVEDQKLKDRLAVTCDNQPFIARAPYVLLFLADYQRWMDYFQICGVSSKAADLGVPERKPGTGDLLLACCDALIAAQTAVIAAESMGIGSCYIGDILERYEIHRELFDLPPFTLPITMLCFGYPASTAKRLTTRYDKEMIVHSNRYKRLDKSGLEKGFAALENDFRAGHRAHDYANAGQATYFRKFASDFAVELNRSVSEMINNWE